MATATKETALAQRGEYRIATLATADLGELLAANLGSGGMSAFDLDRVKVPAGGGTTWQVPSLEGPDDCKFIDGIIVAWKTPRAYWKVPFDESGGGSPPDCSSPDGILGTGKPGGPCKACPLNRFESAAKGDGKACKEVVQLFVVREGDMLPLVVSAPPSSIRNVRQYLRRLAGQGIIYYGAVTRLALTQARSGNGIVYSEIVPTFSRSLEGDELGGGAAVLAGDQRGPGCGGGGPGRRGAVLRLTGWEREARAPGPPFV
jgi:hypothetical protein